MRERALEPQRRRHAEPEHPVDGDRIVDADPGREPLRVVVGHLVGGQVGPHVQRARAPRRASGGAGRPRTGRPARRAARRARRPGGSRRRRRSTGAAPPPRRGSRRSLGCPSTCARSASIGSAAPGRRPRDEATRLVDRMRRLAPRRQRRQSRRGRRRYSAPSVDPRARRAARPGARARARSPTSSRPKSGGSPNADQIASLYKIILYIAAVVFVIVEGALLYSVYKFRAKKGAVAAQIHGNTRLEIGWTVAAALILVVLTVVTFVKLPASSTRPTPAPTASSSRPRLTQPTPPNGKKLTICVQGRQFIWRYTYGASCKNGAFTGEAALLLPEMVVPANTTVVLAIQSTDVIHSWWIPSLGGKVDAVPGYTTYTWFKAPSQHARAHRRYHGQCAQLCGRSHAAMTALVQVVSPPDYKAWLAQQNALITPPTAGHAAAPDPHREREPRRQPADVRHHRDRPAPADTPARAAGDRARGHAAAPDQALGRLGDDHRPQEDRDPLPGHDVRVLHARRGRGAADAHRSWACRTTRCCRASTTTSC